MSEYLLLLVSTVLVNNFVLVKFLGLCPFMGVSSIARIRHWHVNGDDFVLTLASIISYLVNQYLLLPFDMGYLRTMAFILVIAVVVQFTEMVVQKTSASLHRALGIYR